MAEKTTQTTSVPSDAEAPVTASAPIAAPSRRAVTVPVLPLAIVGSVLVAAIFFGGGVAVGFAVGDHSTRVGIVRPFHDGRNGTGPFGGQPGFGQNGGQPGGGDGSQNGGQDNRPAPAPTNG